MEGGSEDSVGDSVTGVCGEFRTGNTVSRGGDKTGDEDEVAQVEVAVDVPREEYG